MFVSAPSSKLWLKYKYNMFRLRMSWALRLLHVHGKNNVHIGFYDLKLADIENGHGCQIVIKRISMTLIINLFTSPGNAGGACTIIAHLFGAQRASRTSSGAREEAKSRPCATSPDRAPCAPAAPPHGFARAGDCR